MIRVFLKNGKFIDCRVHDDATTVTYLHKAIKPPKCNDFVKDCIQLNNKVGTVYNCYHVAYWDYGDNDDDMYYIGCVTREDDK